MSTRAAQLRASDAAANAGFAAVKLGGAVLACPLALSWVGLRLVDETGAGVADAEWLVIAPDGTEHRGMTDANGQARVNGIPPGTCKISFPKIDADAWAETEASAPPPPPPAPAASAAPA